MSYHDNDYTDDMYERYMHTGEGAEYFEDATTVRSSEILLYYQLHKPATGCIKLTPVPYSAGSLIDTGIIHK